MLLRQGGVQVEVLCSDSVVAAVCVANHRAEACAAYPVSVAARLAEVPFLACVGARSLRALAARALR